MKNTTTTTNYVVKINGEEKATFAFAEDIFSNFAAKDQDKITVFRRKTIIEEEEVEAIFQ